MVCIFVCALVRAPALLFGWELWSAPALGHMLAPELRFGLGFVSEA